MNGWTKSVDDATEDARQNDREANLRAQATLGNKTKTQLAAEERVMKSLVVAVVSAEADPELKKANAGFVESVAEHFAMLFNSPISFALRVAATRLPMVRTTRKERLLLPLSQFL